MAKIVKTLTVSWQWSGDKYSLRGFNLAVTPTAKNPKEEVVATAFVETKEIKQTYSYKMGNVTLDKDAQYKIWVQAVYENSDSDWVSTGGATVTDDGSATIITKTDREIQDIVNMASDNILTRQEKISLRREWQEIVYEFLEIESTAISQGIPSSNTTFSNFKSKGNALGTYLNGGTAWTISSTNKTSFPLWINDSNLGSNTSINGNTYRETFRVYYEAKVKILEEINKYKVNNVQIGGINLLTGTKDFNVGKGSGTIHSESYKGFSVLYKDMSLATSGTSDVCMWSNAIDVKQNTEYTLSFYAKGSGSFSSYFYPNNVASGYSSEGKKTTASDGALTHTLTSSWKKYWITWKTSTDTTGLKNVLPMRLLAGGVGYICGVKFEEGNKATDWSPSLEEMENAYTIILTNEAQVIPTNSNRVPTSSTTYFTDIQVYQGTVQRNDYTIGTVNSANGITVSKTSSRVNFAVSTNTALTVDGGNFTIPITVDGKTFNKTFSWSCSKQGNTGATGASGIGISSITEYYAVSSSNTTEPTSWSTTVPTMTATNKYLWNYETIAYSNNTTVNTSKKVIGAYGDKGATGSTGAAGNGISKIVNYYLATSSSSGVTTSTSGWTTSVQSVSSSKKYLWNYEVVTYTNGSTNTTTPCIIGAYGDTGDSAKTVSLTSSSQVFKSTDGGLTFTPDNIVITPNYQNVSYSKWQYSTNGGSSWTDVSSSTNGVTYSSTSLTLSKSSTLFTNKVTSIIFKIITNNSSITDTITIVKLYDVTDLQIGSVNRLAKTNKSVTMSTNQTGTGYNVFDPYKTPSNKYLKDLGFKVGDKLTIGFDWSISQNGANDLRYGNARAELCGKTSSSDYAYIVAFQPNPFATFSSTNTSGRFESTLTVTEAMLNVNGLRIRIDNSVLNLTISKVKLEKGNKATDWSLAPEELENAYSIILTNEAQVIPTNSSRVPTSSTTYYTDIVVYQGTTQRTDYTIGTINSANGITVSKTSSRVNFAVSTGTAIAADGGNFTIPITIDGKTFNKTFSWSCSKQGNTGATGNAGQDAITIILSNENHTFPCESNGNIPTALSTTCVVSAYKGATSVTPTIGTITNPTGITITKSGATITIQANTGTSLADSGTVNIPITVDGKTFNKTFTWSKAKKGATGATGATGAGAKTVDIIASSQVFKSTDGGLTFSPTTIKLTPKLQNVTYSNWQYSTNGGSSWTNVVSGEKGMSIDSSNKALTVSKDSSAYTDSVTSVVFRLNTNDSSVYDTMTIVKLCDIADLEIGGRNYLQNSNFANGMDKWTIHDMSNSTGTDKSVSIVKGGSWADPNVNTLQIRGTNVTGRYGVQSSDITLVANTTYTISGYCAGHRVGKIQVNVRDKQNSDANIHTVEYNPVSGGNSLSKYYKFETTFTTTSNTLFALNLYTVNLADNGYVWFANVKLEKGNKASDWIPAPEDVDKNINDVKNSLNSFQNTVNTSFKDGIIEQAEAKAIAQHLKTLDAEKADIDKEYSTIYSNANLTGSAKTNLASAKTSFDSAHASLKSTINTVISDGKVTSSESASVTSTFNTYNTQLGVYKQRVQEALDNISSGKVDKVEIGGRNLARKGSVVKYNSNGSATTVNDANFTTDGSATISRTAVTNEGAMIDRYVVYDGGVNYVAAFKMRTTSGTVNNIHIYNGRGHKNSKVYIDGVYKGTMGQDLTFPNDTNYHKVEVRFEAVATDSSIANEQNTSHIIPQPMKGTASAYTIQILNLKIEKGNKATDWTPAPEDVKNHAEQSAQNAVNAQTQNSIFNKLTNNGQTQGIYLENSKIYINGEYIKANTLSADKVLVGDYTNYCQLTEQTPMSDKFNKYTHSDGTIWHEMKTLNRDTRISRDYSCKGGEKFRVTGYVYGKVTSTTSGAGSTTQENTKFRVGIFGKKTDGSSFWLYGDSGDGASTGSIVQVNKIITLPSDAKSFYVALQIDGYAPFSGVARCRNIEVRRMNTGELIVDGSITAKSLHADVLSANSIVSTINGGSTNISGNKIRTGTIQSNNGKSTINLDNGSMNLGTTSDASYLQWTGSALNIKANSINIGSSSVATTTDVTNKINNIKIGGTNLIKKKSGYTNGYLSSSDGSITNTGSLNSNQDFYTNDYFPLKTGESICFTSYPKPTVSSSIKAAVYIHVYNSSKVWQKAIYHDTNTANATANKIYTATENCYIRFCSRGFNDYNHMAEYSTKPSQWSPAPEDIETTVSAIEKRVTSAEQKITDTAITNTVKKNFYTKTETENAITSKGYATQSQVQQTADNIQFKFTQTGGYNLIRNGNPKPHNYRHWWVSDNANWYLGRAEDIGVQTTDTNEAYAGCATFQVQSGKTYSLSCWLMAETNTKGTDVYFIGSANDDGAYTEVHHLYNGSGDGKWVNVKATFTVGSNINYGFVRIDNNGRKDTSTGSNTVVFFSEVQMVKGSEYYPQWSPNPNEVYDGIVQMDKNGIKVSTSNGGWTDFTSLGMNVYNKSSALSLGTRNGGLTYHGGGAYLGFTSESIVEAYNTRGVSISTANGGEYITLGHSSATDPFGGFSSTPCLSIAKQDFGDSSSFYRKGVNIHTTLNLNTQNINRMGTINFATNNTSKIYESTVGNLCMFGDNGAVLGYREGNNNVTKLEILEGSDKGTSDIHSYAHWRFHQWNLTDVGQLEVLSRLKMQGTSSIHFNANATHPSAIWHSSNDNKLNIFGDNGVDIGYRVGDTNKIVLKTTEGEDGAYRIQSFSHWHFNNWNLDYVGNVHAQKFTVAGTSGAYYITKGTGDGADYTTYGCLFYTHNGVAFTANGGSVTLVVQGRSGRIMGKNAYYVNSSKCLKSDIRAVTSESEPMPVNLKQGEVVDETLTMEMIGDFIDTIGIRTYITDFEQEGATQKDVDPQQGHVLNLGYIADDLAHHPVFKYIGEKTPDNLYAINSNSLTTVALAGLQAERKERRKLEQRLQRLEAMLLKGDE